MNDYGSRHPQQFASAGPTRRPSGPPPRPPVPGRPAQSPAQGRPAPRPQQYPAGPGPIPAQRRPDQQGPAQRRPDQQGPAQPRPAQPRPAQPRPAQQRPVQPQPRPGAWQGRLQGTLPAMAAVAPPVVVPVDDPDFVPTRKRSRIGKVVGLLVVLAALGGVGWVLVTGQQAPVTAAVGACVTQSGTDGISVVGCGDPSARFKVAGKLDGKTVIDASLFACADFPDATSSYWQGVEGRPGSVLCLAPLKPTALVKPAGPAGP